MKHGLIFLAAILLWPVDALAEQTLILDPSYGDVISGTVTKVRGDSVFIANGTRRDTEVRFDGLDLGNIRKSFPVGSTLSARGHYADDGYTPVFEAHEVITSTGSAISDADTYLFNYPYHRHEHDDPWYNRNW